MYTRWSITFVAVSLIVVTANLWFLWPSAAGKLLVLFLGAVGALVYMSQRRPVHEAAKWTPFIQCLFGFSIGILIICATEAYLTWCHSSFGVDLGDRERGQYCALEQWLFRRLMEARKVEDFVGDYGMGIIALLVLAVAVIRAVFSDLRFSSQAIIAFLCGRLADGLTVTASALVALTWFSFWPVVDGGSTAFARAVADFRTAAKLEGENDRFLATDKRQNELGLELIRLLQRESLSAQDELRADAVQNLVNELYVTLDELARDASSRIGAERARNLVEKVAESLLTRPRPPLPPPPVCGSLFIVCEQDIGRLAGATRAVVVEQRRAADRENATNERRRKVHVPLVREIEKFLRTKHGREPSQEAARQTADIILSIVNNETPENLGEVLGQRRSRAQQAGQNARMQVALLVCQDLGAALSEFLTTDEGRRLIDKIVQDRSGFVRSYPAQTAVPAGYRADPLMQEADRFVDEEANFDNRTLRATVLRNLPSQRPGFSESLWSEERGSIATLVGTILRNACHQGLSRQAFAERLSSFVR